MQASTLLTVFSTGMVVGIGLTVGTAIYLRSRLHPAIVHRSANPAPSAPPPPDSGVPTHRASALAVPAERLAGRHPVADLAEIPVGPYDPDEATELAEEPTLYEDDDLGPHLIEPRIGEEEPEFAGLPRRPTSRP